MTQTLTVFKLTNTYGTDYGKWFITGFEYIGSFDSKREAVAAAKRFA